MATSREGGPVRRVQRTRRRRLPCLRLLLLLLALAPTAAAEPMTAVEAPPPALARIYFYRQFTPLLIALSPEVIVNGKSVGDLSLGEVFFRDARPGRYRIFLAGDPEGVLELDLAAGEIGFVRATLRVGLTSTRIAPEEIAPAVAAAEIGQLLDDAKAGWEPQASQR